MMTDKTNKKQIRYSLMEQFKEKAKVNGTRPIDEARKMRKELNESRGVAVKEYEEVVKEIIKELMLINTKR